MRFCCPTALLLLTIAALPVPLSAGVISFEGFPDSTILTSQYPGLTFSNTIVLTAGISLNEFEFPPRSDSNVASDNGGPVTLTFATPVANFSGYFTYGHSLTLQAFGASNNLVASAVSHYSNNEALSGATGSQPNELVQVASAAGIAKVVITGDPAGTSFTLDDVTTGSSPASVPTLSSFALLILGSLLAGLGVLILGRASRREATVRTLVGGVILTILGTAAWTGAEAQSNVGSRAVSRESAIRILSVGPRTLKARVPTTVTVTAQINQPAHIPGSVNLIRLDASGSQTVLGRMTGGGKGTYTSHVQVNEPSAGQIRFQVSVAIRGQMRRVVSEPFPVDVEASP